jgi:DNA repair exonuclease SbcCD nuclease subunit
MTIKVLICGDPHIQVNNITEINMFMKKLMESAIENKPDFFVCLGDVLHTHEHLHSMAMNKAYEFINNMRQITKTFVLVGNHDAYNNQIYLNDNHWMNGMKEWENTTIVDRVVKYEIDNKKFLFSPYVPPKKFEEALNTINEPWNDSSCIFAHQEFEGCKMGAIISVDGDKWALDNPLVISGHIHSRQIPQPNIYYSGSALQHAFGESEKNIIAYFTFNNDGSYTFEEINLHMPRKKIIYMDVEDIINYEIPTSQDQIKLTLKGNFEQFKAIKKTQKYKKILETGIKIVFKPKKIEKNIDELKQEYSDSNDTQEFEDEIKSNKTQLNFISILEKLVLKEENTFLNETYQLILNRKENQYGDEE